MKKQLVSMGPWRLEEFTPSAARPRRKEAKTIPDRQADQPLLVSDSGGGGGAGE